MDAVRTLGKQLSNWGRWGADDERGTLNFITPDVVKRAAGLVRRGQVFSLGLTFGAEGPQIGQGGRVNPLHFMTAVDQKLPGDYPDGFRYADDVMVLPLQCATQWDSLAHVHYDGQLYNGFPATTTTSAGASKAGIDKVGAGVVSRGVLLDVARLKGEARLKPGTVITPADLEAAERAQGVRVERGDVLLVRTGQMEHLEGGDKEAYRIPSPGLTVGTVPWFRERDVAAVATDTMPFEVWPGEDEAALLPVHLLHLVEMGMTQGQNWVLDELARDCAADGVYEFLLSATPEPFVGAVGSPVNPVATK